jgi:hypothetical protein
VDFISKEFSRNGTGVYYDQFLEPGKDADDRRSKQHQLNNNNIVQLSLLLEFKPQFLTTALFLCN